MQACASREAVGQLYGDLKWYVEASGYAQEIDSQEKASFYGVDNRNLLRECAWVILGAGFSMKVVSAVFEDVGQAFLSWRNVAEIASSRKECEERALEVFGHRRKVRAIGRASQIINDSGARAICENVTKQGPQYLEVFPHIGPVTSLHLAKNLGMNVVKPDRHLVRIAEGLGYRNPDDLCRTISEHSGDLKSTVDLVLWRYATLVDDYVLVAQRLAGMDRV